MRAGRDAATRRDRSLRRFSGRRRARNRRRRRRSRRRPASGQPSLTTRPRRRRSSAARSAWRHELTADDQDLLLWDVGRDERSTPWRITLTGVGGTLTEPAALLPSPRSRASSRSWSGASCSRWTPRPRRPPRSRYPELLLPAGRYLLGVSRTDRPDGARPWSFDYRFDVEAVDALESVGDGVRGDFAVEGASALLEPALFDWTVPDDAAEDAWSIEALTPLSISLTTTLEREDGTPLVTAYSDAMGRVLVPDLRLAPGRYRLRSVASSETSVPFRVRASAGSPVGDPEPNDFVESAVPLDPADPGRAGTHLATARPRPLSAGGPGRRPLRASSTSASSRTKASTEACASLRTSSSSSAATARRPCRSPVSCSPRAPISWR